MTDDGDRIVLGDRVSKIRNRDGDSAAAFKVWEKVDRYAQESRTLANPPKISDSSRHLFAEIPTVTPEEREILHSPYEILLTYGADGRLKRATLGDSR